MRRALAFLRPYAGLLWTGQIAMLVSAAAGLVLPACSRVLVDALTGFRPAATLGRSVAALGGSFLVLAAATFLRERSLGSVGQYVTRDLRKAVYEKLAQLSVPYVEATSSGELLSVITNDVRLLQEAVAGGVMYVATQAISAVAVAVMLVGLDAPLTLLLCAAVPPVLLISRWSGRRAGALSAHVQADLGRLTAIVSETLRGLDVLKAFVLREEAAGIFGEQNERVTQGSIRAVRIRAAGGALTELLGGLFVVLVVGVGSFHVARGRITPGALVAYLVYAQMLLGPLGALSGIWVDVKRALAAGRRVFAVLDAETERDGPPVAAAPPRRRGRRRDPGAAISLRDVWFRYGPRSDTESPAAFAALRGVSLDIGAGESVAVVGPSGAGKSTLLRLLLRFYAPQRGAILLDGVPIEELDVDELRREVALVMQDTHLFDLSVRDNILCGDPRAGEGQSTLAARRAHAHEFVAQLPEGYSTRIGENGARLSGGQRQRIALARAFLRRPRLLLLDEATSSLDTESERRVQGAMRRIMQGRTSVVVAHRLATVRNADRIFVMSRGRVVASGTHDELLRRSGLYARLCRDQLVAERAAG